MNEDLQAKIIQQCFAIGGWCHWKGELLRKGEEKKAARADTIIEKLILELKEIMK